MMRALVIDRPGSYQAWRMADLPLPTPGAGDIRVKIIAAGLNPADYKIGKWGNPAWTYPFVLGLDAAGVVDAVGPDAAGWRVGERVYYHGDFTRRGSFAEYAVIPGHVVSRLPDGVDFIDGAAVPCAGYAAYQAIHLKLKLSGDETVLVQGAAGGVGTYAVQLCAALGAEVVATTSEKNREFVHDLGADHVIDYQTEDIKERVLEITGGSGVDAVIDAVSQETTTAALELITFGGQIACVDSLPRFSAVKPFEKAFSLHEIALGVAHLSGSRKAQEELAAIGNELGKLLATGRIKSVISEVIPLEGVPAGLAKIEGRHVRGKIVALVAPSAEI